MTADTPKPSAREVLLALAARCEREAPSEDLDFAIAQLLPIVVGTPRLRPYTSSLDAAVTLVPPNCWRETNGPRRYLNIPTPAPNYWRAEVTRYARGHLPCFGWAATEAMAICAASLRSLAQEEGA